MEHQIEIQNQEKNKMKKNMIFMSQHLAVTYWEIDHGKNHIQKLTRLKMKQKNFYLYYSCLYWTR